MSINRQMAKGAAWMMALRMFNRIVGFVSTLILARVLVPADFGLVAMATVLMAFLSAVSDFSVHVPLIQKSTLDREDLDGGWSLNLLISSAQAATLLVLASPAATFYEEPRVTSIIYALAAMALLKGFSNIGIVMFQRELNFQREFVLMAINRVVTFTVTMTCALLLRSYWALIAGMLSGTITGLILSYVMHPFRPRLCRERWEELFKFSKWMILNNILRFLTMRGPELILGRLIGPRAVGLFAVGYEIGTLPTSELVAPINRAALPGYSRLKEVEGALLGGYLDVLGLIALIAIPAAVGLAATVEILVPVLLGENWLDAIPVMRYLALAGAIGVLMTNNSAVYMALGKPQLITWLSLLKLSLLIPGMFAGAAWDGVTGVAAMYTLVEVLMLVPNLVVLSRTLGVKAAAYAAVIYRPVTGAVLMYGILSICILPWIGAGQNSVGIMIAAAAICTGILFYGACVLALWLAHRRPAGAERRLLSWLTELWIRTTPRFL